MSHVVLLGDSIFDNAAYVAAGHCTLNALQSEIGPSHQATLLAIDGAVTSGVADQVSRVRPEHTHLVISTGGNDALSCASMISGGGWGDGFDDLLAIPANLPGLGDLEQLGLSSVRDLAFCIRSHHPTLDKLTLIRAVFRRSYRHMLSAVLQHGLPTVVCTVYDQVPGVDEGLRTALALFNEVILFEATAYGLPVLDLRSLCDDPADFSEVLEIEPSAQASRKMARAIGFILRHHDFSRKLSVVYGKVALV